MIVRQPTTRVASLKDPRASSSTDQVAVPHVPVPSLTCAAVAVPPTSLSSPAPLVSQRTAQGPTKVPAPATVANDKVRLLPRNILPPVSTLAPDEDLLTISVLCRTLPTFRSQERPRFIHSNFGRPEMDLTKQLRPTARAPHFGRFFHR